MKDCLTDTLISFSKIRVNALLFALSFCLMLCQETGAQTDSLHLELRETVFVGREHNSSIKKVKGDFLSVDIKQIQNLPKILGNTDPLSFIRMLPGVQTGSEYDSGINIQGCDNAHNDFSLAGVPVFGVTHLFGLFSVFNPSHYKAMTFSPSSICGVSSNRLGGMIRMELPDTLAEKVNGEISVGLMSSQGTVGIKTGRKSFLHLSARHSYLNMLYGPWLKVGDDPIRYSFGDYNLTWHFSPGQNDRIWIDFYTGNDKASMGADKYNLGLSALWGNLVSSLHWEHKGEGHTLDQTLFFSDFLSEVLFEQSPASMTVNSGIAAAGYKAKLNWRNFCFGADMTGYRAMPQHPHHLELHVDNHDMEVQYGLETDIWAEYTHEFQHNISLTAGLNASLFISPEREVFPALSPLVKLSWNGYRNGRLSLSYGLQTQYLFQVGISNIGLPMDFWFLAGNHSSPQSAHSATLNYRVDLFGGALALSMDAYYKYMYNQVEYKGDVFDMIMSKYDLDNYLLKGTGHNFGVNVMLHKQSGRFTGWISYSLGRALRAFDHPDYTGFYPANHERIHDLSAVASYDMDKWNFAGNFVVSSGRPFTAPEAFYITSGSIITKYGEHNACRLRPYIRLDVSVNRAFIKNEKMENGINLSVYNVLARKNEVMWRLHVNDDSYAYRPLSFFLVLMPSISYYHKF